MKLVKTLETLFNERFNSIAKLISFNRNWHSEAGGLRNAVVHETYRLIMAPGEFAKTVDNFGRKIIFMGTHYGIVVLHQLDIKSVGHAMRYGYDGADQLVTKEIMTRASGTLEYSLLHHLLSDAFTQSVEMRKAKDEADGIPVNDGMKIFQKKKPRFAKQAHKPKATDKVSTDPTKQKQQQRMHKVLKDQGKKYNAKHKPQKTAVAQTAEAIADAQFGQVEQVATPVEVKEAA